MATPSDGATSPTYSPGILPTNMLLQCPTGAAAIACRPYSFLQKILTLIHSLLHAVVKMVGILGGKRKYPKLPAWHTSALL